MRTVLEKGIEGLQKHLPGEYNVGLDLWPPVNMAKAGLGDVDGLGDVIAGMKRGCVLPRQAMKNLMSLLPKIRTQMRLG